MPDSRFQTAHILDGVAAALWRRELAPKTPECRGKQHGGIHGLGPANGYGIPSATMHCGSPNGYLQLHVDGNQYRLSYKASRRPADHQMHIFTPPEIKVAEASDTEVVVNVFLGNEKSITEMRLGDDGTWIPMTRDVRHDPYLLTALPSGHGAGDCEHIWVAKLLPMSPLGHTSCKSVITICTGPRSRRSELFMYSPRSEARSD